MPNLFDFVTRPDLPDGYPSMIHVHLVYLLISLKRNLVCTHVPVINVPVAFDLVTRRDLVHQE